MPPPRILIVGGTFDPPHRAHVELPAVVARTLGSDVVLYVPAARNPLRPEAPEASDAHRLAMLALAIRRVPGTRVSTVEIERGGPSYFVDTVTALRAEHGRDADLRFLIGADQALDFHRWRRRRRILELAAPVVVLRPPWDAVAFEAALRERYDPDEAAAWRDRTVSAPLLPFSSTSVRERLRDGHPTGDALDPAVAAYIEAEGLYRRAGDVR